MAKKNAIRTPATLATPGIYERVSVDDLDFDSRNPRFVEYLTDPEPSQKDLLRILWQEMAVDELALSIAASGYFDHEPLFVTTENGRFVVIEGNRRLAAVKSCWIPTHVGNSVPQTCLPSLPMWRVPLEHFP